MEYTLYRFDKTKIAFENYYEIHAKLFQQTLSYLKFYVITYFVKYIQDYRRVINYITAYNKIAHKYFSKGFHQQIYKKKYKL